MIGTVMAVAVACGSSDSQPADQPTARATITAQSASTATPQPVTPLPTAIIDNDVPDASDVGVVLAGGEVEVPAASSFDDPEFHFAVSRTSSAPAETPGNGTLVLTLRDLSRPDEACSQEHPLSGCLTVDWSDFEGRPGVPPGGVLENSITLQLVSGPKTFYLTERSGLADQKPPYSGG